VSSRYVDLFDFCYFCITVIAHCARVQTVTVCFIAVLFIKCFVYCVNKLSRCCFGWNVNRLDFTLDFLEMTVQCSCTPTVQFAVVWRLKLTEELTAFFVGCLADARCRTNSSAGKHRGFICSVCGRGYESKQILQRHMKCRHAPPKQWFKCSGCDKQFRFPSDLKKHSVVHEVVEDRSYVCEVCDRGFPDRLALIGHMHSHAPKSTHVCRYCRQMFEDTEAHAEHEKVHADAGEEMLSTDALVSSAKDPFECYVCKKGFTTFRSLKRHVRYTHDPPKLWHKCDKCDKRYRFASHLKTHSLVHVSHDARPHVCSVCNQGFMQRYALLEHTRRHTGERPFSCRVCQKTFAQIGTRNTHEMVHYNVFPYICSECGMQFRLRGHLSIHAIRKHQDGLPHACSTCGKRFKMAFSLKVHHKRAHTDDYRYVCAECPSQFKDLHGLKRHVNAVHLGLKPWHCNVCDKAFTAPENLRTHMRVHTGEKPYVCTVCGVRFAHSGTHKSHLRTHDDAEVVSTQPVCS